MTNQTFPRAFLFLTALTLFCACSEDDTVDEQPATPYTCAVCVDEPEALPANDNQSAGIYKGVFIGSSGTIIFDIANSFTTITAVLQLDGETINLSSTVTWEPGNAYLAPFTGTHNNSPVSITFEVGSDGENPTVVTSDIPGHPGAIFTVVKETSNSLMECYEGTYHTTKPEDGTFNVILSRSEGTWVAIARENGETSSEDPVYGTLVNGTTLVEESGITFATLTGDVLTGSFVDTGERTVTIEGERTL